MAIDIGLEAINRLASWSLSARTLVGKDNPANGTGTITDVDVWLDLSVSSDVWFGTFSAAGNVLTCRDSESVGAVASGSKQSFSGLDIDVTTGDYLGAHSKSGTVFLDTTVIDDGFAGFWYYLGEVIDPTDSQTFSVASGAGISLYGIEIVRTLKAVGGGATTSAGALMRLSKTEVGSGASTMASTLARLPKIGVGSGALAMTGVLVASGSFFAAVGSGAVGLAGTLSSRLKTAVGGGALTSSGALGRAVSRVTGAGSVGIVGTLARLAKIGVGSGALTMAGVLEIGGMVYQAVGEGAVASVGALGRFAKTGVGGGTLAMTGVLETAGMVYQAVGEGAVASAGSLIRKIYRAVGEGATTMAGSLGLELTPVVEIDGVQIQVLRKTLLLKLRINERSVAEFTVIDKTGSSHYQEGQQVQIWDNAGRRVFGGKISKPLEERQGDGLYHHVTCADYHYLADKRIVAETYEDQLAGDIVRDVRTNYLDAEGVTIGTIQDGPTLSEVTANYVRVTEFLDALAEKAGFLWEIDELKRLNFLDRATNVAPWTATELKIIRGSARVFHNNPLYRNRQYIRGGKGETSSQVENRTGDAVQNSFAMGYPLAKVPAITVQDRGAQTVGIKGIDSLKDWYWSKGDPVVTADVPPEAGKAVQVTYVGEYSIITLSEDNAAIVDRQTVEGGGSGYVDDVHRDANLTTVSGAFEAAGKKLQKYAVMGRTFTYLTHQYGIFPGMLQPISYPPFNLSGQDMLVTAVTIRGNGKLFTWEVTAVEGPDLGGWPKFFSQLVEREMDRLVVGEDSTVVILKQESEAWGWTEAVAVTPLACPIPSATLYPSPTLYPC